MSGTADENAAPLLPPQPPGTGRGERGSRILLICATCWLIAACAETKKPPTSQPMSVRERGEQALRDPANFQPEDPPTVSGRKDKGIDKQGIRRDWERFWNP